MVLDMNEISEVYLVYCSHNCINKNKLCPNEEGSNKVQRKLFQSEKQSNLESRNWENILWKA